MLAEAAAVLALAGADAHAFAKSVAYPRPAGSAAERRAQERVARRFGRAGLQVRVQRFSTPRGRSRNVIGIRSRPPTPAGPRRCVRVLMAHADSIGPGALDNASGLGLLAALAPRLDALAPPCDVWLVATGAEERLYTGSPNHLGSLALTKIVPRQRVRVALSLDEVGRGRRFLLRSPAPRVRPRVEGELLRAGRERGVRIGWRRDEGTGNSDHREFDLAGMPAVKLGVRDNRCRHLACDRPGRLHRRAFALAQRVVEATLVRPAAPARRPPGR